jgi:hypothetical protein
LIFRSDLHSIVGAILNCIPNISLLLAFLGSARPIIVAATGGCVMINSFFVLFNALAPAVDDCRLFQLACSPQKGLDFGDAVVASEVMANRIRAMP